MPPFATWTSRIDKDAKEARNKRIFDLWLACHTQGEIAEAVGVSQGEVAKSIPNGDIAEWNNITMELREFIKSHIENGKDIVLADAPEIKANNKTVKAEKFEALDDLSKQIVNILEEYVKPAVVSDGGNIEFESYDKENNVVKVILQGACSGCPSSTFTLKTGIENMLQEMLNDKDLQVEAING